MQATARPHGQDHSYVGTTFEPVPSIDHHRRGVEARHPGAAAQFVGTRNGVAYWCGDRIVAEIRRRGGRHVWEGWIAPAGEVSHAE